MFAGVVFMLGFGGNNVTFIIGVANRCRGDALSRNAYLTTTDSITLTWHNYTVSKLIPQYHFYPNYKVYVEGCVLYLNCACKLGFKKELILLLRRSGFLEMDRIDCSSDSNALGDWNETRFRNGKYEDIGKRWAIVAASNTALLLNLLVSGGKGRSGCLVK